MYLCWYISPLSVISLFFFSSTRSKMWQVFLSLIFFMKHVLSQKHATRSISKCMLVSDISSTSGTLHGMKKCWACSTTILYIFSSFLICWYGQWQTWHERETGLLPFMVKGKWHDVMWDRATKDICDGETNGSGFHSCEQCRLGCVWMVAPVSFSLLYIWNLEALSLSLLSMSDSMGEWCRRASRVLSNAPIIQSLSRVHGSSNMAINSSSLCLSLSLHLVVFTGWTGTIRHFSFVYLCDAAWSICTFVHI